MTAAWQIQGRDALSATAGDALGGSLGVYIQGITTGGTSSLSGSTSPTQTTQLPVAVGGAGGVTSSQPSALVIAIIAALVGVVALKVFK